PRRPPHPRHAPPDPLETRRIVRPPVAYPDVLLSISFIARPEPWRSLSGCRVPTHRDAPPGLRLAAMWGRLLGAPSGSGRLAIGHPSEARTSFRLTPAPPTPRPSASPPHTRPRRSPEDALPPCQAPAPAPATPAEAGGLLRRIFPRERQRDIRRVLLLIHLEVRLGSPKPLEHPLFLDPIQKMIGILRIQRLACLQR